MIVKTGFQSNLTFKKMARFSSSISEKKFWGNRQEIDFGIRKNRREIDFLKKLACNMKH